MLITNTFFWVKIVELINGVVCYALKTEYIDAVNSMVFQDDSRLLSVKDDMLSVAVCAFPFIISLAVMISYVVHGNETDKNIMVVLFSCAGFVVYLASGIFILEGVAVNVSGFKGAMATGVMCVLNSLLFLFDALLMLFCKCIRN